MKSLTKIIGDFLLNNRRDVVPAPIQTVQIKPSDSPSFAYDKLFPKRTPEKARPMLPDYLAAIFSKK